MNSTTTYADKTADTQFKKKIDLKIPNNKIGNKVKMSNSKNEIMKSQNAKNKKIEVKIPNVKVGNKAQMEYSNQTNEQKLADADVEYKMKNLPEGADQIAMLANIHNIPDIVTSSKNNGENVNNLIEGQQVKFRWSKKGDVGEGHIEKINKEKYKIKLSANFGKIYGPSGTYTNKKGVEKDRDRFHSAYFGNTWKFNETEPEFYEHPTNKGKCGEKKNKVIKSYVKPEAPTKEITFNNSPKIFSDMSAIYDKGLKFVKDMWIEKNDETEKTFEEYFEEKIHFCSEHHNQYDSPYVLNKIFVGLYKSKLEELEKLRVQDAKKAEARRLKKKAYLAEQAKKWEEENGESDDEIEESEESGSEEELSETEVSTPVSSPEPTPPPSPKTKKFKAPSMKVVKADYLQKVWKGEKPKNVSYPGKAQMMMEIKKIDM